MYLWIIGKVPACIAFSSLFSVSILFLLFFPFHFVFHFSPLSSTLFFPFFLFILISLSPSILFLGRMMSRALRIKRDWPGRRRALRMMQMLLSARPASYLPFSLPAIFAIYAKEDMGFYKSGYNRNFDFHIRKWVS